MARTQAEQDTELAKTETVAASKKKLRFSMFDAQELGRTSSMYGLDIEGLEKAAINSISAIRNGEELVPLTFPEDPTTQHYVGLYKPKTGLIPDNVLKLMARSDDLVASILHARSCQISAFGRELQDRFSTGFRIEPRRGVTEDLDDATKKDLLTRISRVSKLLTTCGHTAGFPVERQMSMATFLYLQARNAILFGRFATELVHVKGPDGKDVPHSFRPVDAGTIYQAQPREGERGDAIRRDAIKLLEQVYAQKLVKDKVDKGHYVWYQVINNIPRQGYESHELCVQNVYPTTDLELGGYPLTPLDTVMTAVMTHINITTHNKLYFQNGRAARGMVIIRSEDNDQDYIDTIRQHFQATSTGVEKSFRVPVFGIGKEDEMTWQPIELQQGRDAEFQYLSDSNARVILSAFQMSPEELPGYQHLARGTNNMALSESNNEYKLEAARDIGIRPLLSQFQDFINNRILPLFDPLVAKYCTLKLYGLDADSPEREATRLQQDMALHMTYNEVLERVEKDPIPAQMGGDFPLNPAVQAVIMNHVPFGEILEHFFKRQGAAKDPALGFIQNQWWFNWQQMLMQQQQAQQEQQMQQQQTQAAAGAMPQEGQDEITAGAEQALGALGQSGSEKTSEGSSEGSGEKTEKSEQQLTPQARAILSRHKHVVKTTMDSWKRESQESLQKILAVTKKGK
jgi:hypothetical protein